MNIGLFTDTYYPQINGVATSVLMLKENLETLGHCVYVFTTTDPNAPHEECHVFRIPSLPFVSGRRIALFYHPGIANKIKDLNLDLIHTHTEFPLGIWGRRSARKLGIPMVHTMHTIYEELTHYIIKIRVLEALAKSVARSLSKRFCNSADAVIVPTEKIEELLKNYGVEKDISVIPTGIELDKFSQGRYSQDRVKSLRAQYGVNESDKVLLYIGRISKEKNIAEILHGLTDYLPQHPNVKFLLVGDGPEREILQNLAKCLGIAGQVQFIGEKPWEQIGLYYQLGDVFISASQSETQGLTYIEALAAGLPLIAKTDRCLNNVLFDGVNGFTFSDQDSMCLALNTFFSDSHICSRMSSVAAQSVTRFSAGNFAKSIAALYEGLLGTSHLLFNNVRRQNYN